MTTRRDFLTAASAGLTVLPFAAPAPADGPELTHVHRKTNAAGTMTAIARGWAPGHSHARCGLCPARACNLTDGRCLVMVKARVEDDQAEMFSLKDFLAGAAGGAS